MKQVITATRATSCRNPHRSGRDGFPHPVPRSPQAAANGEPNRRHPVWRITLLSLALLNAVNDPGLWKRKFVTYGRDKLLPVYVALVAASAQPIAPSTLGILKDAWRRAAARCNSVTTVSETTSRRTRVSNRRLSISRSSSAIEVSACSRATSVA